MEINAGLLRIDFYLGGCRSLKEKRQRLKGLRERFGRSHNVAVCESDYQDSLNRAQWAFVATAGGGDVVERALGEILLAIETSVDAQVTHVHREKLV